MGEFMSSRDGDIATFLREMSCYFAKFRPGANNFYRQIMQTLKKNKRRATFVTTNYELLIELSAFKEGFKVVYGEFPTIPNDYIKVFKVHGSCNFLPDVGDVKFSGVTFTGGTGNDYSCISGFKTQFANPFEVIKFCKEENSLAPAISVYAKGKQVFFNPQFVNFQQASWVSALSKTNKIFIVGLRVNPEDRHIWTTLKNSKAHLFYVGRENDNEEFLKWRSLEGRKHADVLANSFEEALPKIKSHLSTY
jgi:hypothetical protein